MPASTSDLIESFAAESEFDQIEFWHVVAAADEASDADLSKDLMSRTLALVARLLERGFRAGQMAQGVTFVPWIDQNHERTLGRIEREWRLLGREPNIGDICWFDLPNDRR